MTKNETIISQENEIERLKARIKKLTADNTMLQNERDTARVEYARVMRILASLSLAVDAVRRSLDATETQHDATI